MVLGFSFFDKCEGEIGVMMYFDWVKCIEVDLWEMVLGLLMGGSLWSNIYIGGVV